MVQVTVAYVDAGQDVCGAMGGVEEKGGEIMEFTFEGACKEITECLAELVISKQRDYGKANILDFGEFGVLVRLNDKVARLKNLQGKDPHNESTEDTWKDIAGYAIIALMLREESFNLPLKEA